MEVVSYFGFDFQIMFWNCIARVPSNTYWRLCDCLMGTEWDEVNIITSRINFFFVWMAISGSIARPFFHFRHHRSFIGYLKTHSQIPKPYLNLKRILVDFSFRVSNVIQLWIFYLWMVNLFHELSILDFVDFHGLWMVILRKIRLNVIGPALRLLILHLVLLLWNNFGFKYLYCMHR